MVKDIRNEIESFLKQIEQEKKNLETLKKSQEISLTELKQSLKQSISEAIDNVFAQGTKPKKKYVSHDILRQHVKKIIDEKAGIILLINEISSAVNPHFLSENNFNPNDVYRAIKELAKANEIRGIKIKTDSDFGYAQLDNMSPIMKGFARRKGFFTAYTSRHTSEGKIKSLLKDEKFTFSKERHVAVFE